MAEWIGDGALGYLRSRTTFSEGWSLRLDESYRLAHLPLIAPDHPDVIASRAGKHYEMGRHPAVTSLVLPIDMHALAASPSFRAMEQELRAAPFADKVAWDLLPRRASRLHATLCGSLKPITDEQRQGLESLPPFRAVLRGLFSGNVNLGRLYLRLYPQCRDGLNPINAIQAAMGRQAGDLYLVGLYNLRDHLDVAETEALAALIERHWPDDLLEIDVDRLWLLRSRDALVLDAAIDDTLHLRG